MLIMQQWEVASPKYSLCFATEHKRSIYSNRTVSLSVQCNYIIDRLEPNMPA